MKELLRKATRVPWEPARGYPAGTRRKVLRRDPAGRSQAELWQLPPFFESPFASLRSEDHHVIEGEYEAGGRVFLAGDRHRVPAHADAGPVRSVHGAVVLVLRER